MNEATRENFLKELGVKSEIIAPAMVWSCELPDRPATIIPSFCLQKIGHHIEVLYCNRIEVIICQYPVMVVNFTLEVITLRIVDWSKRMTSTKYIANKISSFKASYFITLCKTFA